MAKETKALVLNGGRLTYNSTKAINPWDVDSAPEAWSPYENAQESANKLVPAVYHAWQTRCKAMADLPFAIFKGETEVDNSDGYKNTTGMLADPRMFFWMCEASLVGYGSAYWSKIKNTYQYTKQLKYFKATSITPRITPQDGLVGFERRNGANTTQFKVEDVLYMWLPDPAVEVGVPTVYPLKSALTCAGALERINWFVADFMNRGMVKATMLTIDSPVPPTKEQKEDIEGFWNKFMRGIQTRFRVFSNNIKPTIVGEGLEAFRGIEITTELMQQIHTAMGTRHLLEDENYATAQVRQREFYVNTIMPDARLIADALNKQVLDAYGMRLEFQPERLEAFKTDESERATALATLAGTLTNSTPEALKLAMSLLGYELTPDQEKILDQLAAQKEADRQAMQEQLAAKPAEKKPGEQAPDDAPMREDMRKFLRKACKKIGQDVAFESDCIPADMLKRIHDVLPLCKCEEEVRALFDKPEPPSDAAVILEAIKLEVEAIKASRA